MLHASSGSGGGNQASINAFTIHYNLEIAEQFIFLIHDHAFIIHHHHNQSIKCLMFDLLATQLSEIADRQVWPGRRSSAVAHCVHKMRASLHIWMRTQG